MWFFPHFCPFNASSDRCPACMIISFRKCYYAVKADAFLSLERPTEEQKDEFFGEIQTMKTVSRHPNIVALLGFCTRKEPLQIVMEYVGCGDLVSDLMAFDLIGVS